MREGINHMAQGVLILRMTESEEGLQQTLDMAHRLQPLGDLRQALGNQRLDIFTQGQVSRLERQQSPHIVKRKPSGLGCTDEANNVESLRGVEPVGVFPPCGGVHQSCTFVVAQRGGRHPRRLCQLPNRVVLGHTETLSCHPTSIDVRDYTTLRSRHSHLSITTHYRHPVISGRQAYTNTTALARTSY